MAEFNISEALYSLNKMLQEEIHVHNGQHIYEAEERSLIADINNYFITDYQIQRRYIPDLLVVVSSPYFSARIN